MDDNNNNNNGDDPTRIRENHSPGTDKTRIKQAKNAPRLDETRIKPVRQQGFDAQTDPLASTPNAQQNNQNTAAQSPFTSTGNYVPKSTDYVVLRNRFVLEETLGVGGMGVVYKARDLRKVEAKDRNPYIAVKVLSEDFRHHPEAFIALEREARKSQSIAHPNIVNVHDFDRDGATVFMTMEYMQGKPLDKILRELNGHPMPHRQAMEILKGMSAALAYAHAENIVHADFKPGNVFVTRQGVVKVFDFGIARAVARVDQEIHHHDKSIFDPHTLGALTPTYASVEMLCGARPTAQDDIFALACVAYEMFSGVHPFDRIPADQAMARKFRPKRIMALSRKQWKILKSALSFKRQDRINTVHDFIWDFTHTKKSPWLKRITAVLVIVAGVLVYFQYFHEQQLSPEEFRAKLGLQIKVDFLKERITSLLMDYSFSDAWQIDLWEEVRNARVLMGIENYWLIETESIIVNRYLKQIKLERSKKQFTTAEELLAYAQNYRGDTQGLEMEQIALKKELAEYHRQQRIAREKQQRLARERAAREKNAKRKKKTTQIAKRPKRKKQKPKDVFALAINNIKQQLRCRGDINTRDFSAAVRKAKSISARRFLKEEPRIIGVLAGCIEHIGSKDSNRAQDLKIFALKLFPGNRVLKGIKIAPKDPCSVKKAGLGRRGTKGTCRDRFYSGGYGPRMIVIPAGNGIKPFAIGQFEVSIGELNEYCKQTKQCASLRGVDMELPATNVSFDVVKAYARWLKKRTGYTYRPPRKKEWLHAARAKNSRLDDNRNCTMSSRGINKGEKLIRVTIGKKNKWGMVNYVGNAQEWVLENNRDIVAMGGAHTDPIAQCQIDVQRSHSGKADAITGFRLLREIKREISKKRAR